MPGAGSILVRRAIILAVALIIILFLTGIIMEATGYSERIWKAMIDAQVRAYQMRLRQRASGGFYCINLGSELRIVTPASAFTSSVSGSNKIFSGTVEASVTSDKPLQYKDPRKPPGLPEISIANITIVKIDNETIYPHIVVYVERPDGVRFSYINTTAVIKGLNLTNFTSGVIQTNKTYIAKPNTNTLKKSIIQALETKYFGGKKVTLKATVNTLFYSVPEQVNGKIAFKPLTGTYKLIIELTYYNTTQVTTPFSTLTVRISPPRICYPISDLVRWKRGNLTIVYGLNKPWYHRVIPLVINTLMGNLGETDKQDVVNVAGVLAPAKVWDVILIVLPRTIVMLTVAEIICMAIALPLAPKIAYHYGTKLDRLVVSYAALFNAIPVWWLGLIFIFFFAYELHIFPPTGTAVIKFINDFWKDPLHNTIMIAYYAALPIITIVITFLGGWLYSVRAVVLRIVREDFVTVAKAKGLPESMIVRKYIVRVAAPPIVTYVILGLAGSIGGLIITESVFYWPGMGSLYYAAIVDGDVATILGLTYVFTLIYVIARWILEALYIWLDPRVRYR